VFAVVYYWMHTKFRGSVRFMMLKPWVAKRYDTMRLFKVDDGLKELINRYKKAEGI